MSNAQFLLLRMRRRCEYLPRIHGNSSTTSSSSKTMGKKKKPIIDRHDLKVQTLL